jgi:hypothetical protein
MYLVLVTVTIAGYTKDWRTELLNGGTSGESWASKKERWTIFRVAQGCLWKLQKATSEKC